MNRIKTLLTSLVGGLLCFSLIFGGHAFAQDFRSGASAEIGVPVDFNILYQRANTIYDIVEHDDRHVIWTFTGTTGDRAFVFADGRIAVASAVEFDLAAKDTLERELNYIIDMLNVVGGGVSSGARASAIDSAVYYSQEESIYHRIKHSFSNDFSYYLTVPSSSIKEGR